MSKQHTIPVATWKHKDIRGRRIKGYTASIADLHTLEVRPTEDEAISDLYRFVFDRCTTESTNIHTETFSFNGVVYIAIVWRGAYSWEYKAIEVRTSPCLQTHTWAVNTAKQDKDEAIAKCYAHIAQVIYGSTANTVLAREKVESFLKRYADEWKEFCSWADWQERYAVYIRFEVWQKTPEFTPDASLARWNRFDICLAWYVYACESYDTYEEQCIILKRLERMQFKPGLTDSSSKMLENWEEHENALNILAKLEQSRRTR